MAELEVAEGDRELGKEEESSPFLSPVVEFEANNTSRLPRLPCPSSHVKQRYASITSITVGLVLLMAIVFTTGLLVGDLAISKHSEGSSETPGSTQKDICSNPPILLISMDGFRPSYLSMYPENTSVLSSLAEKGVRPPYMRSAFPSKTFPNHFSIVTGLYPESHGIVGNTFYDMDLGEKFNSGTLNDPKWWLGEPIWVTAGKRGLNTGVFFWPGSEVAIEGMYPTYYFPYSWRVPFEHRVGTVLSWLDLPQQTRPQFMSLYFNEPDHSAHSFGPNSPEVDNALGKVQTVLEGLMAGLESRGLSDCVNFIFTSDHGMAKLNSSRLVIVDDLFPSQYSKYVSYAKLGVIAEINIVNGGGEAELAAVYSSLVQNSTGLPISVYLREELPLRLHAGQHNKHRYGDIYIIGDVGAYVTTRQMSRSHTLAGMHGYDNNQPAMKAFFLAHGPAFKQAYKPEPFDNIQVYNLMCALLDIPPAPNNGSVGSLNHLLSTTMALQVPTAVAPSGLPGQVELCSFPTDQETYFNRSFCSQCVCGRSEEVDSATINAANQALNLTDDEVIAYQQIHLPWGVPRGGEGTGSCLLTQPGYVTLYSTSLHVPLWTAYKLTADQLQTGPVPTAVYRQDPRMPLSASPNCSDYQASPYLMAPLVPAGDVNGSLVDQLSTALLTNTVPQAMEFHQGVWSSLEDIVRRWATIYGTIYVVSGVILDVNHDGVRDGDLGYQWWLNEGRTAVPTHFYKILVRCTSDCSHDNLETLAVVLPQTHFMPPDLHGYVQFRLATIRDIEGFSGVNFFPHLSPEAQNTVELRIQRELWPYKD